MRQKEEKEEMQWNHLLSLHYRQLLVTIVYISLKLIVEVAIRE